MDVGTFHACALTAQAGVRCWGYGGDGALGYGNTATIGDDETPAAAGPVDLGPGRTALAVSTGAVDTCAVLDDHSVRCWGFPGDGRLGYGNVDPIGDNETPGSVGPVNLGAGRTASAISAGRAHTCALLDDGAVRCWGFAGNGQLGYGDTTQFSDTQTPDTHGPVQLGAAAVAITAGSFHTCALLVDGNVRCWGFGRDGELGYGNTDNIGDNEVPTAVAPVNLGDGRHAVAIDAGASHTCAILDNGTVRCWGAGADGRLGYGNTDNIGDDETPGSLPPVDLGAGRTAVAISAGATSTCARLDDGSVRCWGAGFSGALGYCGLDSIGDDETPGSAGPVDLGDPGIAGAGCPTAAGTPPFGFAPNPPAAPLPVPIPPSDDGLATEHQRAAGLRACRATIASRAADERRRARSLPRSRRAATLRQIARRAGRGRSACLRRYARTPGRVSRLTAKPTGLHTIVLTFGAVGSDGAKPPAARRYVVKQSLRPIRTAADFRRAHSLCRGTCSFEQPALGGTIVLRVNNLTFRHTYYYYALSARDNVTGISGPRSAVVRARTG